MANKALAIERIHEQIRIATALAESIKDDDAFTDAERKALSQKIDTMTQKASTARSKLQQKMSLYEQNVQKTSEVLRRRKEKLDKIMTNQSEIIIGEIMQVFVPHHNHLLSNFEKSKSMIIDEE